MKSGNRRFEISDSGGSDSTEGREMHREKLRGEGAEGARFATALLGAGALVGAGATQAAAASDPATSTPPLAGAASPRTGTRGALLASYGGSLVTR